MDFYSAEQSRVIDQHAMETFNLPGILLMKRAAFFAFHVFEKSWSEARKVSVVCGLGNNAGDGYILAELLYLSGYQVQVYQLGDPSKIKGDALTALNEMSACGLKTQSLDTSDFNNSDVIVDAIFGTGLNRNIEGEFEEAIRKINAAERPVFSLDIPSGLDANTGKVFGTAVMATHTCSFITRKIGLYTYLGPETAGKIHFSPLFIGEPAYAIESPIAQNHPLKYWLTQRPKLKASSHKGSRGTCCLIGGNTHMMGAIQLAGLACLTSGAGLVKIITQEEHCLPLTQAQPELMTYTQAQMQPVLLSSKAVAIGPGLGQDEWAAQLLDKILKLPHPKVIDADALNLLAKMERTHLPHHNWVLTPHPAEAARLLNTTTQAIQNDRIAAIKALQSQIGGVIVLKGNGTLIYDGNQMELCTAGNAGMAVGGMGDVLTGVICSFLGQGMSPFDAACLGVTLHAHAGDVLANQKSQAGVIPSDLALTISHLLNYAPA